MRILKKVINDFFIFETKSNSIGLPRKSNQILYVVSRTDTVIRTPGIRGLQFSH